MKAAQIIRYSKDIQITVNDIPVPEIGNEDILIRVKAASFPLDKYPYRVYYIDTPMGY